MDLKEKEVKDIFSYRNSNKEQLRRSEEIADIFSYHKSDKEQLRRSEEIADIFSYHKSDKEQLRKYKKIREETEFLAYTYNDLCPESNAKRIALEALEKAMMFANASIARKPDKPRYVALTIYQSLFVKEDSKEHATVLADSELSKPLLDLFIDLENGEILNYNLGYDELTIVVHKNSKVSFELLNEYKVSLIKCNKKWTDINSDPNIRILNGFIKDWDSKKLDWSLSYDD
jgi:hypothetical protein